MISTLKNMLITATIALCFLLVACSTGTTDSNSIKDSETGTIVPVTNPVTTELEKGSATVKMFVPDYYALSEQDSAGSRAIAPQTKTARLSYLVNGSWVGINSVSLADSTKTPVQNAPAGFTGSVYSCTFTGVPVGTYNAGNLQIELMDAAGVAITSGTNATSATITKGSSASTTFYTVPLSTGANTGNLAAGEMKFSRAALVKGVEYPIAITSNADYPDVVLFKSNGQLYKYFAVDSESSANITLSVEETDVYFLGIWADDGKDIARYTLSFDFGNGTEVKGVLTGDSLNWTKSKSPYIVNGNLLVREDSELTIEPGVIVQFTGDYYLKVNGVISAVGSKADPIIFVQSGDNLGTWSGISIDSTTGLNITDKYTYASGNILKNCMVIGAGTPLTLNSAAYVDSCTFTGNSGGIGLSSNSFLINNIIDCGISEYNGWNNPTIINNKIRGSVYTNCCGGILSNNSISNANIHLNYSANSFRFVSNNVNSCSINIEGSEGNMKITGNNFLGYNGTILDISNNSYASRKSFNFTGNYWGEAQTQELNLLGDDTNISFFNDYYDNFEWTEIDYSNWATESIEGAGYLGDGFIAFDYTINGYNFDNGGYYPESTSTELAIAITPQYHANDIASVRVAQSLASLKNAEWTSYSANKSFTVDKNALSNGLATIYVQLKDSKGNVSSPLLHEVPFDNPVVTLSIEDGVTYSSATSSVNLNFSASDNGNLSCFELSLDDVKVLNGEDSYVWGKSYEAGYSLGLAYMSAGTHTLKLIFWDNAGNSTTKTIHFTINRTVNTASFSTAFDSTTGQLLKDSNTVYLWHLDSDGKEASGNENATISSYSSGTGGFGGYGESISCYVNAPIETAFTIEFWRKNNDYLYIYKESFIDLRNQYFGWSYKSPSGSISSGSIWGIPWGDNSWHYYAFVYDGNYAAIYRDGNLVRCSYNLSQTLNANGNQMDISAYNIDELRISKTARSADEIAAYYAAAKDKIQ